MVDIAFLYSIVYEDKYFLARYGHSVETKIFNQPYHRRSLLISTFTWCMFQINISLRRSPGYSSSSVSATPSAGWRSGKGGSRSWQCARWRPCPGRRRPASATPPADQSVRVTWWCVEEFPCLSAAALLLLIATRSFHHCLPQLEFSVGVDNEHCLVFARCFAFGRTF